MNTKLENNNQPSSTAISQIFPSLHTPIRLPVPPTALTWLRTSPNCQCLITGMQNGSIGITWYTNDSLQLTSLTLHTSQLNPTYKSFHIRSPITHVTASPNNKQVAVGGYYGSLTVLNVSEAPTIESRMLTSVDTSKQSILGLKWSWDGKRVACLRAKQSTTNPLSLMFYSNVTQSQYNNIEMTFPRRIVGQAMIKGEVDVSSHRIAWNKDDASLFMSLTHGSLLQVSTRVWRIIASFQLDYSTQIQVINTNQLIAVDGKKRLSLFHTTTNTLKELARDVENVITHDDKIVTITSTVGSSKKLVIFDCTGKRVNQSNLPTTQRVTSLSVSPNSSLLFYTTPTQISSLLLYSNVPTLKQLSMNAVNAHKLNTSYLPAYIQHDTDLHHNVLLPLRNEIDLCVYKVEKKRRFGISSLSLEVSKHYLGQVLHVMRFESMGKSAKLKEMKRQSSDNLNNILNKLLPSYLSSPAEGTKIKWNNSKNKFSIRYNSDKIVLKFKADTIYASGCIRGEFKRVYREGTSVIQLEGQDVATITYEPNVSRLRLHTETERELSHMHTLLVALAAIIRN